MNELVNKRVEYEIESRRMAYLVRSQVGHDALSIDMETETGVRMSVIVEMERGGAPDMESFLKLCAYLDTEPGRWFRRVVWRKYYEGKEDAKMDMDAESDSDESGNAPSG